MFNGRRHSDHWVVNIKHSCHLLHVAGTIKGDQINNMFVLINDVEEGQYEFDKRGCILHPPSVMCAVQLIISRTREGLLGELAMTFNKGLRSIVAPSPDIVPPQFLVVSWNFSVAVTW